MTCILPGDLGVFAGGAGGSPWNTVTAVNMAFSNANRTATGTQPLGTNPPGGAKGVRSHSSGKFYFEIVANVTDAANDSGAGLADTLWVPGNAVVGNDGDSTGFLCGGLWFVFAQSLPVGSGNFPSAPVNGDVLGFAVDSTGTTVPKTAIWYRLNNLWFNGGTPVATFPTLLPDYQWSSITALFPAVASNNAATYTLNTGGPFANAPPAGYSSWG